MNLVSEQQKVDFRIRPEMLILWDPVAMLLMWIADLIREPTMAENGHAENGAAAEKRKADDTENGENGANGAKREKVEP